MTRPSPIDLLLTRRSVLANNLGEPGPGAEELRQILTAGARVPDHKKLEPWRFILFEGEARARFGKVLAEACAAQDRSATPGRLEMESSRFMRAPVVIAVISRPVENPGAPEWEQVLSCGAVCQNMLHAANALGYSAQWITEWYAYSKQVCAALGLEDHERVAGFVYVGTARELPEDRPRPDLDRIVTRWTGGV
ncbi:MAG: nitroreductase [Pseudomonadota bacterium]|nr:nitroreductase [Pseudomonadota bacterium]